VIRHVLLCRLKAETLVIVGSPYHLNRSSSIRIVSTWLARVSLSTWLSKGANVGFGHVLVSSEINEVHRSGTEHSSLT